MSDQKAYLARVMRGIENELRHALDRAARRVLADGQANPRRKWLCPECGSMGVSSYPPLCHEQGCDFKVSMVEISDLVYNRRIEAPEEIAARALINAGNAMGDPGTRAWLADRADRVRAGTVLI